MPSTHIIQTQIMYRTNFLEPNRTSGVITRNPKCALTHKPHQKTMAETFTLLSLGPFTRQNPREKTPRKTLPECSLLHPSYLTIPPTIFIHHASNPHNRSPDPVHHHDHRDHLHWWNSRSHYQPIPLVHQNSSLHEQSAVKTKNHRASSRPYNGSSTTPLTSPTLKLLH